MAGDLCGQRAVGVEQSLDRHDDLHLYRHVTGGGLPGEPLHQGVGEDLPAGAGHRIGGDVVLVDRPVQRTEARGGLLRGQVRHQIGHPVGGQPDPHMASRPGRTRLDLGLLGCDLHRQAGGEIVHPSQPQPLDRLRREPLIHSCPLGGVEVRRRRDDLEDLVLRQLPGGEQFPHMIEPQMQIPRQVQATSPLERRHPARHRHLGHDLPLDPLRLHIIERCQRRSPRECEFANRLSLPRAARFSASWA